MGKRRDLNGLPNSLAQQFLSDIFYFEGGYMADWVWYLGIDHSVNEIRFDLLEYVVSPHSFQVEPFIRFFPTLRNTIGATLSSTGHPADFIVEAHIDVFISYKFRHQKLITAQAIIVDKHGVKTEGKIYTTKAYGKPYKTIPKVIDAPIQYGEKDLPAMSIRWWEFWKRKN